MTDTDKAATAVLVTSIVSSMMTPDSSYTLNERIVFLHGVGMAVAALGIGAIALQAPPSDEIALIVEAITDKAESLLKEMETLV